MAPYCVRCCRAASQGSDGHTIQDGDVHGGGTSSHACSSRTDGTLRVGGFRGAMESFRLSPSPSTSTGRTGGADDIPSGKLVRTSSPSISTAASLFSAKAFASFSMASRDAGVDGRCGSCLSVMAGDRPAAIVPLPGQTEDIPNNTNEDEEGEGRKKEGGGGGGGGGGGSTSAGKSKSTRCPTSNIVRSRKAEAADDAAIVRRTTPRDGSGDPTDGVEARGSGRAGGGRDNGRGGAVRSGRGDHEEEEEEVV